MGVEQRTPILEALEAARSSSVICYLTGVRRGVDSQISGDAIRVFFDHLEKLGARPVPQIDLFLVSNGGESTVPWRLIALLREFGQRINVLLPYRAYSAATLVALGADEIVMHPFAEMGPIDPTVANQFNPTDQRGNYLGISVEDVKAYVNFINTTAGINHEEEVIKAIEILAEKVHPLALGNVERFISQSRMIARKLLLTHFGPDETHKIDEIVEHMASKLFFHGHPINRKEAKKDLNLKVVEPAPQIETKMWELYKDFEVDFENEIEYNPAAELNSLLYPPAPLAPHAPAAATPTPATTQPSAAATALGAGTQMGSAVSPTTSPSVTHDLLHVMIESRHLSSAYRTRRRYEFVQQQVSMGPMIMPGQPVIKEDILSQGWTHAQIP